MISTQVLPRNIKEAKASPEWNQALISEIDAKSETKLGSSGATPVSATFTGVPQEVDEEHTEGTRVTEEMTRVNQEGGARAGSRKRTAPRWVRDYDTSSPKSWSPSLPEVSDYPIKGIGGKEELPNTRLEIGEFWTIRFILIKG